MHTKYWREEDGKEFRPPAKRYAIKDSIASEKNRANHLGGTGAYFGKKSYET